MTSPLDEQPADPNRQAVAIATSLLTLVDSISILCGEGFIEHNEHEEISRLIESAAGRWTDHQQALKNLDFEP